MFHTSGLYGDQTESTVRFNPTFLNVRSLTTSDDVVYFLIIVFYSYATEIIYS